VIAARSSVGAHFTELGRPERLAYDSLVDFVPGVEPYSFGTDVQLMEEADGSIRIVMRVEPLHDEEWTVRLIAGPTNELDNLARLLEARGVAPVIPSRPAHAPSRAL
jgi:hypothetical protein